MTTSTLTRPTMELSEALRYLRRNRVFLCYRHDGQVDVWSCGRKLPMELKRSVFKHRTQLLTMMREHDWRVCPARELHAFEWVYFPGQGRHLCLMCAQLAM